MLENRSVHLTEKMMRTSWECRLQNPLVERAILVWAYLNHVNIGLHLISPLLQRQTIGNRVYSPAAPYAEKFLFINSPNPPNIKSKISTENERF